MSEGDHDPWGAEGPAEPPAPRPPVRPPGASRTAFVRASLVLYGAMGCAALVWRMRFGGESILYPGGPDTIAAAWDPVVAGLAGAGVGLAVVLSSELMTRFTRLGRALADLLGESLAGIGVGDALLLALASGLGEEMLFRGALQPAVGLVWASVIFGACHFLPRRELALWSLWAVLVGAGFGWLFERTGHLAAPVAAHVVVNAINLPRLARRATASTPGAR
ncbi:MAG: CPBP family intramembrane metalloprotease [Spirochaetaceae bacterium]|nr:CPBP family intramembrane metalloprotease [Myxococcales bacterium]MCB9725626.1 CPBP family intramembrane metalloprotease [Spirochaetaceae bacterium]HPG27395.1 CPBP family intramembrane metalloprotease [Myxococcota bacterium]